MKDFFKKIDNFIVNKITLKNVLYLILALIFINCYNFFVLKYRVNIIDNLLIVFALDLSIIFSLKFFTSIKNRE